MQGTESSEYRHRMQSIITFLRLALLLGKLRAHVAKVFLEWAGEKPAADWERDEVEA